jgi:thymidine phosphorylase
MNAIDSGSAYETMIELTRRQGGDPAVIENTDLLPQAAHEHALLATRGGVVTRCDAYDIGLAGVRLGGGRATKDDIIDPAVGFLIEAKVGESVDEGDLLVRIAYNDKAKLKSALHALDNAWEIGDEAPSTDDLILGKIR